MKTTKTLLLSAVLATLTLTASAQSWLTNGLVAYYPFNGNALDASGNGRHGTNINATLAPDRFGVPNRCYSFNGTNSHVDIGSSIQLGSPHDAMTISVWFLVRTNYNPQFDASFQIITDYSGPDQHVTGDFYFFASLSFSDAYNPTNQLAFELRSAPATYGNYSHCTVDDNRWHSCTVVVDGQGKTQTYVDGLFNTEVPYDSSRNYLSQPFWRIGAAKWNNQIWNVLNGFIDDVRIYNRALSTNEVAQLYAIEFGPQVNLIKAVKPSFSNLTLTTNYQLQVSGDLNTWTNHGSAFTATNTSMVYPQYWDVDNWGSLFFRLQSQ